MSVQVTVYLGGVSVESYTLSNSEIAHIRDGDIRFSSLIDSSRWDEVKVSTSVTSSRSSIEDASDLNRFVRSCVKNYTVY